MLFYLFVGLAVYLLIFAPGAMRWRRERREQVPPPVEPGSGAANGFTARGAAGPRPGLAPARTPSCAPTTPPDTKSPASTIGHAAAMISGLKNVWIIASTRTGSRSSGAVL